MKETTLADKLKIAGIVAGVVFVGLLMWTIAKQIRRLINKPKDAEMQAELDANGNIVFVDGKDDGSLQGFNPSYLGKELIRTLTTTYYWSFDERCEAYKKAYNTTDNQLRAVANYVKNNSPNGETIRELRAATNYDGCTAYGSNWGDLLIARLDTLNIP